MAEGARLGVDIGGTFTDVALERGDERWSAKILTTPEAPERAVIEVIHRVLGEAGLGPADLSIMIHGTTLATNAIIERKGAKTALLTTEGFRDTIEIRHENRFEQYDVNIDLPPPLVPRRLRFPVRERVDAQGRVLVPLDEAGVAALAGRLASQGVEAVAVGFLHSFTNPAHERRAGEILARHLPEVPVTLSSDVSPEMREYERFSTACANAYVQPLIGRYLANLETLLRREGFACPLYSDAVGRRADRGRDRDPLSGAARRIGAGGGCDLRRRDRPPMRSRQGPVLRHGRHHRQDLPDRRAQAADQPRL